MRKDYISTDTRSWLLELYIKMPREQLLKEAQALCDARVAYENLVKGLDVSILSSPVFCYLNDCFDIMLHALFVRFMWCEDNE